MKLPEEPRIATIKDLPAILSMIRGDRGLQQDRLPSCKDFSVVELNGGVVGCCALKVFSPKLAEIRSFAFSGTWPRKLYAEMLVSDCIRRAREQDIYQLMATLCKKERKLFEKLGFRPFNEEKHAMLMVTRGHELLQTEDLPGVAFKSATSAYRQRLEALAGMYPTKLIQPTSSKLFPRLSNFLLATAGRRVVGCCALTTFRLKQGKEPELAEIRSLAVDPDYEHQGIGRQLVTRLINRAIRSQVWEVLSVTQETRWFRKLGFKTRRGSEEAWFMYPGNGNGGH